MNNESGNAKYRFEEVKSQRYANNFYNQESDDDISGTLESQVNFPEYHYEGDIVHSMYTDRMVGWKPELFKQLRQKYFENDWNVWYDTDIEKTKLFLEEYLDEKIDGFRVIRTKNVATGNPLWVFQTYKRGENSPEQKLYSGEDGPLVELPTLDDVLKKYDIEKSDLE